MRSFKSGKESTSIIRPRVSLQNGVKNTALPPTTCLLAPPPLGNNTHPPCHSPIQEEVRFT